MSLTSLGSEEIAQRLYRCGAIRQALPGPEAVTEAHVAEFRRLGFMAVANVFTPQEVQAAQDALSHLIAGGRPGFSDIRLEEAAEGLSLSPGQREPYVRKVLDFTAYDARLKAMAEGPAFIAVVERLLGAPVVLIQEMALLKPPHIGREKPWHQDAAYFLTDPPDGVLGTWIALDEATVDNGCMHVIPGSHLEGPRPHYHDRDCQLPDEAVRVERDVAVPLAPGGALFFAGLLHHGTPPNRSPCRRRALQFHYAAVHCRLMNTARHEALFSDGRGYAGCTAHLTGLPYRPIHEKPA